MPDQALLVPQPATVQRQPATMVRMDAQNYFAAPGLSNSMLKDLEISPLRFWYKNVNPDAPREEPTAEMQFGSALHCAVLEPSEFESRYAPQFDESDHDNPLGTIEELRLWIRDQGFTPKGTRKSEVIAQAQAIDPNVPIVEVLKREHEEKHKGKALLPAEAWIRVKGAAEALREEPVIRMLLRDGQPEVSMFARDEETGVMLKARMDWLAQGVTVDFKTFVQKRGSSIDKSIADAIFYEKYYRQAWMYRHIRKLATGEAARFIFAFVESCPPHEVRIKEMKPTSYGQANLYWETARIETRNLINTYAECLARFGTNPWRDDRGIEELTDEHLRQFAY